MRIDEWGPACWIFFHTIVSKIKPEEFMKIRNGLTNHLRVICSNLPCPSCSSHAKRYFQRQRSLDFQTKEEMIGFWWYFHNQVNKMKGKPEISITEINYNHNNLRNTYQNFSKHYIAKDNGLRMMNDTFYRKNILSGFHKWIVANNHSFTN